MNCRNAYPANDDCAKKHAALGSARRTLAEDRVRLYLLSFLLTADRAKAERCFVPGLDLAAEDNAAIRDWAHSWARRIVIGNALRLIAPRPETGVREADSGGPR
jgi:hypothetical protein